MTDSAPKQEPPYGLRMPPSLKARVKSAAEANNRSMNAEIVARLEQSFDAEPQKIVDDTVEKVISRLIEIGALDMDKMSKRFD